MSLSCSKCGKALTRKRARLIGAKLLCSACLFPATKGGRAIAAGAGTAETGTGSVRSTPERAEGDAPMKAMTNTDRAILPRGRQHFWRNPQWYEGDWYEGDMVCARCGAHGERHIYLLPNAVGWVGKPTYGCRTPTHSGN